MVKIIPNGFVKCDKNQMAAEDTLFRAFQEVADRNGYDKAVISAVYPISESFFNSDNRYKLIDREGDVLCLIDDVVTGLLNLNEGELDRRYAFSEVYRYRGEERNVRQCAALLTGVVGLEGEVEVVRLGLDIVKRMGIEGAKVVIGSTYVLQGLAETYFGYRPDMDTIRAWLDSRPKTDAEAAMFAVVENVKNLKGGLEIVQPATDILTNKISGVGLSNILDFYEVLCGCGLEKQVEIDLSIVGRGYDCGSVFEIRDGNDNVLLHGGRHDFVNGASTVRAVSLGMIPQEILLPYQIVVDTEKNVVIGVADGIIALNAAYKLKEQLMDAGVTATLLYRTDKEGTKEYADAHGVESAVFVDQEGNATAEK